MEDRTEREGALYDRLKQVLCNYIMTQRIAYQQALAACVPVLGFQLWLMRATQDEMPFFIDHAVATLHAQQQSHTQMSLPPLRTTGPVPRTRRPEHWRPPSSRSCGIVRWSASSL